MRVDAFAPYAPFGQETQERLERTMSALLIICMSIGTPLTAVALYDLQAHLEQWDYNRHAED